MERCEGRRVRPAGSPGPARGSHHRGDVRIGRPAGKEATCPDEVASDVARLNAGLCPGVRLDMRETGVLELSTMGGGRSTSAYPLAREVAARRRYHALAGCLAECAMLLGLGTGVYRIERLAPGGFRDSC